MNFVSLHVNMTDILCMRALWSTSKVQLNPLKMNCGNGWGWNEHERDHFNGLSV